MQRDCDVVLPSVLVFLPIPHPSHNAPRGHGTLILGSQVHSTVPGT